MADSGTYDQATIARRQKIAEQMLAEDSKAPNIRSWAQGLSHLAGVGADVFGLNQLDKKKAAADQSSRDAMMELLNGAGGDQVPGPPAPSASPASSPAMAPPSPSVVSASAAPRIYDQSERNPLDPPAGADRDMLIRAIHGEAGNQGPEGMRAVASVVRNRAANGGYGGDTVPGVLQAPNQFEPMNTAAGQQRMAALPAGSNQYNTIGKAVDDAYAGNDPTNGALNFFAPKAQAALGRDVPAWAQGPGQDIGDHRFFGSPAQMAQNDPGALPPNSTPTQGQGGAAAVAQAMSPAAAPALPSTAPPPGAAAPGTPGTAPLAPQNVAQGIPEQKRRAIAALMAAPEGSAARALGVQLAGEALKAKTFGFVQGQDGTFYRTNANQGTMEPTLQAPVKPTPMKIQNRDGSEAIVFVDANNKKVYDAQGKEIETGGAGMGGPVNPKGLSGPDYLASLPEGRRLLISGMLEGRIAPAQLGRYGTKAVQSLLEDAAIAEPGFDTTAFAARQKGLNDFHGGGKSSEIVRRLNQSALHFGELTDKMGELPGMQVPLANKAVNTFNTQVLGKGAQNNFEVNGHALADELAGLFKGAGISDTEIRAWESRLSPNMSEEQQRGMAKTLKGLYTDAMHALEEKRQSALGPILAAKHPAVLGQEAAKSLDKIDKFIGGQKPDAAAPAATEATPKVGDEKQFKQGVGVWNGSAWVPKGGGGG